MKRVQDLTRQELIRELKIRGDIIKLYVDKVIELEKLLEMEVKL
jgi:hypothetical protein